MDGCRLGASVREQRGLYADGVLDSSRQQRLDELLGWSWNAREDSWEDGYHHLLDYVSTHGDAPGAEDMCVFNGIFRVDGSLGNAVGARRGPSALTVRPSYPHFPVGLRDRNSACGRRASASSGLHP